MTSEQTLYLGIAVASRDRLGEHESELLERDALATPAGMLGHTVRVWDPAPEGGAVRRESTILIENTSGYC